MSHRIACLVVTSSILCALGCSAADTAPSPPDVDEGALTTSIPILADAVAAKIRIEPSSNAVQRLEVTIGLPAKVSKIVRGLKKRDAHRPPPRCVPQYSVALQFFDKTGAQIASVPSFPCGDGELLESNEAAAAGAPSTLIHADVDLLEIARSPLVPGDALWGISEIEIKERPSNKSRSVTDAQTVQAIVGAIEPAQEIDRNYVFPRCDSTQAATFKRGGTDVAVASHICATDPDARSADASFIFLGRPAADGVDDLGKIVLDPRPIRRALNAAQ